MKTHANSVRLKSLEALKALEALETVWWIWMHLSKGLEKVHAETFAWEVLYGWKRVANHARSSDQTTWFQFPLRKKEMWGAVEQHRMSERTVSKTELPRPNPTNTAVKSDSVHACVKNATIAHPRCLNIFETWAAWRRFVLNHYVRGRSLRVSCPIFFHCADEVREVRCGALSHSMIQPFIHEKLQFSFAKMRSNKRADTQGLILEMLKKGGPVLWQTLFDLYNKMGFSVPSNWRPIARIQIKYKSITKFLHQRLKECLWR